MTLNGWLQILVFLGLIFAVTKPLGVFMTRVFSRERTFLDPVLRPIERLLYRVTGVDESHEMRWTEYATTMLVFSAMSMLVLYLIQRVQGMLPFNPQHFGAVTPEHLAFNTAASFTTNTNWQAYSGETTMSYFTQMAGLAFHNFASAATGIVLAIAFIRGIARRQMNTLGNFWVDFVRCCLWVLLPLCVVGSLFLVSQGVVQNLKPYDTVKLVEPQQVQRVGQDGKGVVDASGKPVMDTVTTQTIAQGPVASQEIIKEWGTNGGGFFNANSAHPFENPTPITNLFEMFCIFAIGAGLTYTLGRMTGSPAHGWAVWSAMAVLFLCWRHRRVLGRGARAIRCIPRPSRSTPRRRSRAATWKAKKRASASPTRLSLPPSPPTPVAAPSTAGTTPSRRWAAWSRWSTSC